MLYIEHLEESRIDPRKIELFEQVQALRIKNNNEWRAIVDMVEDLTSKCFS